MRRILSILLCMILVTCALPVTAFAADPALPEGLYWRGVAREDTEDGFVVFADPDQAYTNEDITGSPGYSDAREFVYADGNGGITKLTCDDMTFTGDYFAAADGNPMFVKEGEVLVDVILNGTGDNGKISYKGFDISVISVLPEFGLYTEPEARDDTILPEWGYDGNNSTIYFVAQSDVTLEKVYLDEEEATWMGLEIGPVQGNAVALTITDIDSFRGGFNLFYDYLKNGEKKSGENWFFLFDTRPILIAERGPYYPEAFAEKPDWECWRVITEGDVGRWAGYHHLMQFKVPGSDTYITSGIKCANEDVLTLKYDSKRGCWDVDIHNYGAALLTWKDPEDGTVYRFYIHAGESEGLYSEPDIHVDTIVPYYGYDDEKTYYAVDYTIGEGISLYYRDFKGYSDGFTSISVISGEDKVDEVKVEDPETAAIRISSTATGDFDVTVKVTYALWKGEDYGGWDGSDILQISFHGVRTAKRKLRSRDGLVEASVDKENGAAVIEGDLSAAEPVLMASYDEEGRFMGLKTAMKSGDKAQAENGADAVSLFWIDKAFAPKSSSAVVELLTE